MWIYPKIIIPFWSVLLNEYVTVPSFLQSKPKFDCDSLLIYMFCTSWEPESVLPVLQCKIKQNFMFVVCTKHVKTTKNRDQILASIKERMELSGIHLAVNGRFIKFRSKTTW